MIKQTFATALLLALIGWAGNVVADGNDGRHFKPHRDVGLQWPPQARRGRGAAHASVSCGDVLTESGVYRLDQHLVCTSEVAIEIAGSNIKLDMKGYSLHCDRDSVGDSFGIVVGAVSHARISNGTISDCQIGLFLHGAEKSMVRGMNLVGNDAGYETGDPSGLLLNSANKNIIINNVMSGNGHGISLFDSSRNTLMFNTSSDNRFDGLRLLPLSPSGGSNNNWIVRNDFNRNDPNFEWFSSGVQWAGPSTGNVFRHNNTNDNGFLGVLVYGETLSGSPVPSDNSIGNNTSLGNIFADMAELDFSFEDALPEACSNSWRRNTFGTAFGPPMCIE